MCFWKHFKREIGHVVAEYVFISDQQRSVWKIFVYFYWIVASRSTRFICIKLGIGELFDAQHFFKCSAAFPECFAGALKSLDVTHRNRAGRDATEASHGQVDLHRQKRSVSEAKRLAARLADFIVSTGALQNNHVFIKLVSTFHSKHSYS